MRLSFQLEHATPFVREEMDSFPITDGVLGVLSALALLSMNINFAICNYSNATVQSGV
jgi:hypothetical protein